MKRTEQYPTGADGEQDKSENDLGGWEQIIEENRSSTLSEGQEAGSGEDVAPTDPNNSAEMAQTAEEDSEEKLGRLTVDRAKKMWEQALEKNSLNGISKYDLVRLLDFVRKCNDDYNDDKNIDEDAKKMFIGTEALWRLEYEVGWNEDDFEDVIEEYLKNLRRFETEKGRDPGPLRWESVRERMG